MTRLKSSKVICEGCGQKMSDNSTGLCKICRTRKCIRCGKSFSPAKFITNVCGKCFTKTHGRGDSKGIELFNA